MNKRTKKKLISRKQYKTYAKYRVALGVEAVQEYYDEINENPNKILGSVEMTYTRPSCKYIRDVVMGFYMVGEENK